MKNDTITLNIESVMEELAAIEHQRWSHWQKYVHSLCKKSDDGSLIIPVEFVERWERQVAKSYDELSETEKESDREQVRRYLPVIIRMMTGKNLNKRK